MRRKLRPSGTMEHMAGLLILCGISTFVMGALTGSFLGDFLPRLAKLIRPDTTFTALPALFTPLTDTLAILIGSLALGLLQVLIGMAISVVRKYKRAPGLMRCGTKELGGLFWQGWPWRW